MRELELKYGINPNQKPARIFVPQGAELPLTVLNGRPGYINFLDALNSYALVFELSQATGLPAAASFKHVSPAGAAIGLPLSETDKLAYFAPEYGREPSALACAYIRARGADRVSSYGDWIALSHECDEDTALAILPEVSDGVIAPSYSEKALEILRKKKKGGYNIVRIDPDFVPDSTEIRTVYGVTFEQGRNTAKITDELLQNAVTENKALPDSAKRDLLLAMITLKYTQSNSVVYCKDGGAIGVGAGGQSRIHCTRLAGGKADNWYLRRHEKTLNLPFLPNLPRPVRDNAVDAYISADYADEALASGVWETLFTQKPEPLTADEKKAWLRAQTNVALGSDAFFPFGDNIERAAKSGVRYVAQPGGSIRDDNVIAAANKHGMVMYFTGLRLFHH